MPGRQENFEIFLYICFLYEFLVFGSSPRAPNLETMQIQPHHGNG